MGHFRTKFCIKIVTDQDFASLYTASPWLVGKIRKVLQDLGASKILKYFLS